eukprot:4458793-Pleurochrysis_carterae.AAC.1
MFLVLLSALSSFPHIVANSTGSKHINPFPIHPGSSGTKGKMVRKPSQTTLYSMHYQVYEATRLFGDKDLDAPKEVPASQEEFVAGLLGEIGHDSPDGITVAIG